MEITIIKAGAKHINDMANLLSILLSQEADFKPNSTLQKKGLKLIIENNDKGQLFVALNNSEVVGMVNLLYTISTALGNKVAMLEDMVVLPQFRNTGIGSKLIDHAINHAKNQGFKRITLLTDTDNTKAHEFYKKHGFEKSAMVPFRNIIG